MNGNWGEWSDYSECSHSCGGGVKTRNRYCNKPASAHGGLDCLLSDGSGNTGKEEGERAECNAQSCPGMRLIINPATKLTTPTLTSP